MARMLLTDKWAKSTRSFANSNCLEARQDAGGTVQVRDTKDRTGPVLRFSAQEWREFLAEVRAPHC